MDSDLSDAMPIANGCLRPTPMLYYLSILAGKKPAELCQQEAILPGILQSDRSQTSTS